MRREAVLSALEDAPSIEPVRDTSILQKVPLSAVSEVRVSNVDKKSEPGEVPVQLCNYTDVYKNSYITDDLEFMRATASRTEIAKFGLRVGDVIITKDSETPDDIGIPSLVDSAAANLLCGYHLAMARPVQDRVDPTFLAKQLAQPRIARYFGQQSNGSTRYGLSITSIERAPIWLPAIGQQREIGEIARELDTAISRVEDVISKLRQVRSGLVRDLFARGLDDNGELRDPKAHPEHFKDTAIGTIPVEWEASVLGDLVREDRPIVYGILMPGRGFPGGIPVIKVKDIRDGRIDTTSLLLTDPKIDEAYSRSRIKAGDLLFTIRGTVGRMAIVQQELEAANITQDSARVSLSNSNPTFISRWLEMETPTRFVSIHTLGVAVRGINLRDVRRIPTPLVPRGEQDRIVDVVKNIEIRINDETETLHKLECIRNGLLSALLSGHIRVPPRLEVGATS